MKDLLQQTIKNAREKKWMIIFDNDFSLRDGVTEHCEDEKHLKFISKNSWIMSAVTRDI